ncbi:MAG: hypothetical protein M5U12_08665 [Verrucomicrobia bacterium]|nr:hypothetical protein [Verrucomicrobiota bacterium]
MRNKGESPRRAFVPPLDPELVRHLYTQCDGYVQRVWEKLREEHGVDVKYSTLTRWLRQWGIGQPLATRCQRVPDEPGAEMQHDTSPFTVLLSGCRPSCRPACSTCGTPSAATSSSTASSTASG